MAESQYEGHMWVPWWAYVGAFVAIGALASLGAIAPVGVTPLGVAVTLGTGLLFVAIVFWGTGLRKVRVADGYLSLGYGERIELDLIESVEVVDGRQQVHAIYRAVKADPNPVAAASAPTMLLGSAGLGLGQLSLGVSGLVDALAERSRPARSIACPPWTRSALVIFAPNAVTAIWLVGSLRDPRLLANVLRETIETRPTGTAADQPQPGVIVVDAADLDPA